MGRGRGAVGVSGAEDSIWAKKAITYFEILHFFTPLVTTTATPLNPHGQAASSLLPAPSDTIVPTVAANQPGGEAGVG